MLIACALFSCIVVLLGGLNWLTVQSLGGSLQQAVNGTASKANHASSMQTLFQEMRAEARATQISIVIGYYQSRLTPKAAAENTL
ncbi:MAG: hypothetical protein JNK48_02230 [Bryobacterales bacterium]|nr:hypothetical protein [Bryobacterales bacterium]